MTTPEAPRPSLIKNGKLDEKALFDRFGLRRQDLNTGVMSYRRKTGEVVKGNLEKVLTECPHVADVLESAYQQHGISEVSERFEGIEKMYGLEPGTLKVSDETLAIHENQKKKDVEQTIMGDSISEAADTTPSQVSAPAEAESLVPETRSVETHSTVLDTSQDLNAPVEKILAPDPVHPESATISSAKKPVPEAHPAPEPLANTTAETNFTTIPAPVVVEEAHYNSAGVKRVEQTLTAPNQKKADMPLVVPQAREDTVRGSDSITSLHNPEHHMDDAVQGQKDNESEGLTRRKKLDTKADIPQSEALSVAEKYAIPQSIAEAVIKVIDTFLTKEEQHERKNSKEKNNTVKIVKNEGKITIGLSDADKPEAEKGKAVSSKEKTTAQPQPIRTAEQLADVLDALMQLVQTNQQSENEAVSAAQELSGAKERTALAKDGPVRRDRLDQKEKPLDITLLVTEDVLAFLESGKKVFDALEMPESTESEMEEEKAVEKVIEDEKPQSVRVTSGEKEIFIELATLKKLLEMLKERKQAENTTADIGGGTIFEELGLHSMDYQNYDDDTPLLKMSLYNIYSLASANDRQLSRFTQPSSSAFLS